MKKPTSRKEYLLNHRDRVKPYALMSMKEKYRENKIFKIGYLDIETSGLTANFDIMLSWAILVRDTQTEKTEIRTGVIKRSDIEYALRERDADLIDKRLVTELIDAMSDIDCLVGHWFIGKHRHDIPFTRSRCAINKISGFPKHRMVRYGDTQKWGSQIHRLSSNSLATIGDAYRVHVQKTPVKSKSWKLACLGDPKELNYVLIHNIKDVKLTHKIHKKMEEYVPIPSIFC